jgi:flagellar hook-associated protein 3
MDLRITSQSLVQQTIASVRQQFARLARLQEEASTGKRLLRASDAPNDMVILLTNRAQEGRLETNLGNIRDARTLLDVSVSTLRDAASILTTARDVAIEGAHAVNGDTAFTALAEQVDALLRRLVDNANTEYAEQFLYSGTSSGTAPFAVSATDSEGRITSVSYNGALDAGNVLVARQLHVKTLYPGNSVFQPRERAETFYSGQTGSTPGTGLDSAVGHATLIVRHTATSFAPGSGVQTGTGSAAGDTIIGPAGAHRLTIVDTSGTGASGTISLNGGPAFNFTNSDTNLRVSGPNGEVAFVDTTAITAGFNGDVDITADGTLSVDNGLSELPIDFSTNQVVTHSQTGAVTNVNTSNTRSTGTEQLDYSGSYDAFQILIALRDDLRNTAGLSPHDQAELLSRRIGELDRIRDGVLNVIGEQSASLEHLSSLEMRLQDRQLESQKQAGEIESADVSEIVLRLQEQQNLLQLTFASSAQVLDLTLLDFLG